MNGSTLIRKEASGMILASSPPTYFPGLYAGEISKRLNNNDSPTCGLNDSKQSSSSGENQSFDYSKDNQWSMIFDSFMNKRWLEDQPNNNRSNIQTTNDKPLFNLYPSSQSFAPSPFLSPLPNNALPPMHLLNGCGIGTSNNGFSSLFNGFHPMAPNGHCPQAAAVNYMLAQRQNLQQQAVRQQNQQKLSTSVLDAFLSESRLLEDFRAGRLPNLQLRDLVNHVIEFAQDQYGSRFIQQRLQYANDTEKQMVFNEILPSAHLLTINVFGNYVIQKFFELGTSSQKMQLLEQMKNKILNLTLNMYGCRVVQKALERVDREGQRMIANELTAHILRCVRDQNGNHVVQKVIETLDSVQLAFVVKALTGQVVALSTHSYGCRVIQRILERCSEAEKLSILKELIENFQVLVLDQYGNYVVQHILQHGNEQNRSMIIDAVRVDLLRLSQHKFASNVVEKCVEYATNEERRSLIADIMNKSSPSNVANCPLLTMMKDQYANYVVQKMLELADPVQRKEMMYLISYHIPTLKRYTFGKHIISKLEKYFQKNNMTMAVQEYNSEADLDNCSSFF